MQMSGPEIDFLEQDAPAPEPAEAEVAQQVEQPAAPAPVAPTVTDPPEERVPLAALKAERQKRQEERQARERLERELAQLRQPAQPEPDFYADPQNYVQSALVQQREQMTHLMLNALEAQAREAYADYDEVFAEVGEAVQENPALRAQIFAAANPATAAYRLGKQLRQMRELQDPEAYRQKIEAEVRQKIEAEYRAKEEQRLRAVNAIPPDLSTARASKDTEIQPDDSLEAILSSKR